MFNKFPGFPEIPFPDFPLIPFRFRESSNKDFWKTREFIESTMNFATLVSDIWSVFYKCLKGIWEPTTSEVHPLFSVLDLVIMSSSFDSLLCGQSVTAWHSALRGEGPVID